MALLLEGVVRGDETVNIFFHIPKSKLKKVSRMLPKLKSPTVREIHKSSLLDVAISCERRKARELILELKNRGAEGIVEFPVLKLMP